MREHERVHGRRDEDLRAVRERVGRERVVRDAGRELREDVAVAGAISSSSAHRASSM
jgi:hypothetical protein